MQKQNIFSLLLFVIFVSIGFAALTLSILYDDLQRYYYNKYTLENIEESKEKIQSLIDDYDVLIDRFQTDPNMLKRIAPVVIGVDTNGPNVIYPKATAELLEAADKILDNKSSKEPETSDQPLPEWMMRIKKPANRTALYIAGAFLVIISFIFFGPKKPRQTNEQS